MENGPCNEIDVSHAGEQKVPEHMHKNLDTADRRSEEPHSHEQELSFGCRGAVPSSLRRENMPL